jgi:hypothetical protein
MPPYKDADYDAFQGKKEGIDYSGSTAFYRDAVLKKLEADVQARRAPSAWMLTSL